MYTGASTPPGRLSRDSAVSASCSPSVRKCGWTADGDRLADVVDAVGGPGHDEQECHRQGRPQGQRAVAQVLAPREHAQHDQRQGQALERVVREGADRQHVDHHHDDGPGAQRQVPELAWDPAVGEGRGDGEEAHAEHDRQPGATAEHAGGVGVAGERPGVVQAREQRVVDERRGRGDEHDGGGQERRALAPQDPEQGLGDDEEPGEGRALPGLQPAGEERGHRRQPHPTDARRPTPFFVGQKPQGHDPDGNRGEQVPPEIRAGPGLPRDEVELELAELRAQVPPPHQRRDRRAGEEGEHERQPAVVAAREEPARVQQRAREQGRDGHGLEQHVGGHQAHAGAVGQTRQQHARVQERARARGDVVEVADEAVVAGLAQPVQVLERVDDQVAVGAGDHAALDPHAHEQADEHAEGQRAQREQGGELEPVQPQPSPRPRCRAGCDGRGQGLPLGLRRGRFGERGGGAPRLAADVAPGGDELAHDRHQHARHAQPRALAVGPDDAGLAQPIAQRAGHGQRLRVERPAVEVDARERRPRPPGRARA